VYSQVYYNWNRETKEDVRVKERYEDAPLPGLMMRKGGKLSVKQVFP
jgi:hypothetical protein